MKLKKINKLVPMIGGAVLVVGALAVFLPNVLAKQNNPNPVERKVVVVKGVVTYQDFQNSLSVSGINLPKNAEIIAIYTTITKNWVRPGQPGEYGIVPLVIQPNIFVHSLSDETGCSGLNGSININTSNSPGIPTLIGSNFYCDKEFSLNFEMFDPGGEPPDVIQRLVGGEIEFTVSYFVH